MKAGPLRFLPVAERPSRLGVFAKCAGRRFSGEHGPPSRFLLAAAADHPRPEQHGQRDGPPAVCSGEGPSHRHHPSKENAVTDKTVSPAQELRAAASKIRETAEGIPAGPWSMRDAWRHTGDTVYVKRIANAEHETVLSACPSGRDIEALPSTFEHIALWHPGVAEVVAEWLDTEAHAVESSLAAFPDVDPERLVRWPLRIARAINGEVAA